MSLRLKALIAIIVVVVAGTAVLCAVLWRLSAQSYAAVEVDLVTRDAERAHGVLQADLRSLEATAVDWAEWDDTFAFVEAAAAPVDATSEDGDEAGTTTDYVDSNLAESTYSQNGLSGFAMVAADGTTLYAGSYDPAAGTIDPALAPPLAAFAREAVGRLAAGSPGGATGGVLVGEGAAAWEAVAVPILRSDGSGPANGVLLMARMLDASVLQRFGDTLQLPLTLEALPAPDADDPPLAAPAASPPQFAAAVTDDGSTRGYATVATLNGPPLLMTFAESPSTAALSGTQQTRLAVLLVVMGSLMAVVMLVLADRFVLSRLVAFSRTVDHIAQSGDVSTRIPAMGRDEIGRLASGTNLMLTRIEAMTDALETARADAEAGSKAKSEFLANMSHELRTPLHAILGMSRLAAETESRGERADMLAAVDTAATSLLEMVDDVLVLSQEEAGQLELNPEPFSPDSLAGDLADAARDKARPGVDVDVTVGTAVAPSLVGDVDRIRHCVGNLVGNAVKFTTTGSVGVALDCEPAGGTVDLVFVVTDTGAGIPPERLARVLDAFEQADTGSTRRHGGTGLGVTVAARLARRMGGTLTLESEAGVGTTATVRVPVSVSAPVARPRREADPGDGAPSAGGALRVLVVEDNPVNQRVACRMLDKLGHRVEVVDDGAQAVPLATAGGFDVVLMDVQMPVMDGLAATRHIRAAETGGGSRVPIVALTAHAMAGDRERCIDAGMDAYVTKPFNAETLADALANVTGGTVASGSGA